MKNKLPIIFIGLLTAASASAQGLYYVGSEAQESIPLKWAVGVSAIYDDNVAPGNGLKEESSVGINPYVGLSVVNITPQTTWDIYARLGLIYYADAPDGIDDVASQSRVGVNLTHRFSERLRFSSRNFVSYELEPDYSSGIASSRQLSEYFYWQTDNSIGYRWTERFATYTGFSLTGATYPDLDNNDRFTWEVYNQLRYQLGPQTVLTGEYRYGQTYGSDSSSDSHSHYILAGVEQRFSPTTVGIIRVGAQLRGVDDGQDTSSPYGELALNSQMTEQFSLRAFARYGIENYDTVRSIGGNLVEFDDRRTFRLGISSEYAISPMFSVFGGIDYIPTSFNEGRITGPGVTGTAPDQEEEVFSGNIGMSVKFNDYLTGTAAYTYTNQGSDFTNGDYDRNRFSIGVSAEF
ncbi:MAG: outer membrane beta-barrel protein [Akkermansiaceae bacterium]|nr:outer membrane beta-barrel protein [Akkermansiaceae bacterium]